MPTGPFDRVPRPLATSNIIVSVSITEERRDPDELEMETVSSNILDTQTQVTVSESFEHEGSDVVITTSVSELNVGLIEELEEVVGVRTIGDIPPRDVSIIPTAVTGPAGLPRMFADSTVKVRSQLGIDGAFPPIDVQISTLEAIRSELVFGSTLATDMGGDFVQPIPRDSPIGGTSQYMMDIVLDTGNGEATLEEIQEIIIRLTGEVEDLGFLIADRRSTVLVG